MEIEVGTKEEDDGKYSITIVIIVTDNEGKEFSVGRLADVLDAKIVKIQNLNNTGSAAWVVSKKPKRNLQTKTRS